MRLYESLSRLFPRSFTAKVFFVAFCGTHIPLIALVLWALLRAGPASDVLPVLIVALVATLAGTAATLFALSAILAPLYRIGESMRAFEERGEVEPLPFRFQDQIGLLMQRTNRLVLHVDQKMDDQAAEAETDPLTGIANRRGFDRRARRVGENTILLIDIDRFKSVNDSYGHDVGDRVLRQVAGVLHAGVRPTDLVARLGGEEFVVQLVGQVGPLAMDVAERLGMAVESEVRVSGRSITISVGVAEQRDGAPVAEAVQRADKGTYAAKSGGRNRVMPGPQHYLAEVAA
jgi:diguanylate cyclase (GGDEF)-like protein